MPVKSDAFKLIGKRKEPSLEELKQKYLTARHSQEKKILLFLIRKKDPKFKG